MTNTSDLGHRRIWIAVTVAGAVLAASLTCAAVFSRGHWSSRAEMLPCEELVSRGEAEHIIDRNPALVNRLLNISDDVSVTPERASCPDSIEDRAYYIRISYSTIAEHRRIEQIMNDSGIGDDDAKGTYWSAYQK
jgi:hypothetical protein